MTSITFWRFNPLWKPVIFPTHSNESEKGWGRQCHGMFSFLTRVKIKSCRSRDSVESFRDRALISPKIAMMETWSNLVSAISEAVKQNDPSWKQAEGMTSSEIVNRLFQLRMI